MCGYAVNAERQRNGIKNRPRDEPLSCLSVRECLGWIEMGSPSLNVGEIIPRAGVPD